MSLELDHITITYHGFTPRPGDLTQRQWNAVKRAAWYVVGEFWHSILRPKHFSREGGREYGYAPRSGEAQRRQGNFWRTYMGQKQKRYGHQNPLVLTGELQDRSRVGRIVPYATANASGVRVYLPQAQKANWINKHGKINMRDELTAVSAQEGQQLTVELDDWMGRELANLRDTETVTIT